MLLLIKNDDESVDGKSMKFNDNGILISAKALLATRLHKGMKNCLFNDFPLM
jgi:hypothetical protein